jgi:gamma-glutamyl:cysteine ligase YbdK (ATP-grasp superfamily)
VHAGTDFGVFFDKMARTGVVKSMKDFYWDIRPKPEFGTIEVRVLDTPLTIEKAAALAGYICSAWRAGCARAAVQPAGGRLPALHLQPLPGLPLRPRRHLRRPRRPASTALLREDIR